jgi:hypothetical protein
MYTLADLQGSIRVRIAPDPQLAVCKGLVSDRVRKLVTTHSVLGWRCCRSSYGTLCKILYDKKDPLHQNKQLTRDPLNGKLYITQAIAWFVKKGEPVSVDTPIVHNFVKKVSPGDPRRAFPTSVVECSLEAWELPEQMTTDTRLLCSISSNLSPISESKFTEKNKRFWSLGKHYFKVEYQVRVLIGPADIRFELWFDNQKMSMDTSIMVDWVPTPPEPTPDIAVRGRSELSANPSVKGGVGWSSGGVSGNAALGRNGGEEREGEKKEKRGMKILARYSGKSEGK